MARAVVSCGRDRLGSGESEGVRCGGRIYRGKPDAGGDPLHHPGTFSSAVYSGVEKRRLRRENEWYEERIRELENGLVDENDLHVYIKRRVDQLEKEQIAVNCFGQLNIRHASSEMEMLLDRIFSWILLCRPECAKVSFRGEKDMVMINVSFPRDEKRDAYDEEVQEIRHLAKKMGGTAVTDATGLSAMAFEPAEGGEKA